MFREGLARWVLRPYVDLTSTASNPLHAEALVLQVSETLNARDQALTLLGMWMPPGYRRRLRAYDVVPSQADLTETTPISVQLDALRSRLKRRDDVNLNDKLILARLSEYELLVTLPPGSGLYHHFLCERATAFLAQAAGQTYSLSTLRSIVGSQTRPGLDTHIVRSTLIVELVKRQDLAAAKALLLSERLDFDSSTARLPQWLANLCHIRLEAFDGYILEAENYIGKAVDKWMECLNNARNYLAEGLASAWVHKEFQRRLIERTVRAMLQQGWIEDCVGLAKHAVRLDPHDQRAWLLLGDSLFLLEPTSAAEAYRNASYLDPTWEALAAYSAGRALERAGLRLEALHEMKRSLDREPKCDRSARELLKLVTTTQSPLAKWACTTAADRDGWVFTTYRPFFDLGPAGAGPLFNHSPEIAFDQWHSGCTRHNNIQRVQPPGFRVALCEQARKPQYDIWEPSHLSERLWTDRWAALVEGLRNFDRTDLEERYRLCSILTSLAMYEPVLYYLKDYTECPRGSSSEEAELGYRYAFAESMLLIGAHNHLRFPVRFELIAERAPACSHAVLAACLFLVVYAARYLHDVFAARKWLRRAHSTLELLAYPSDSFASLMWKSRLHRAGAYIPFLEGNFANAIEELEQAFVVGSSIGPATETERIIRDENLYPILHSTANTYVAVGKIEKALELVTRILSLDPWDSMARMAHGELLFRLGRFDEAATSYEWAVSLGPPGTAAAAYLAGEAHRARNRPSRATHMHLQALQADPNGISPRKRLAEDSTLQAARSFASTG
jgi:tetratricopeptide (TPR) repeat protein